ncbi:hypothetical protein EJ110_NYTH32866 [Nymphaea thermarum]|nr:hypothetical protein EJ110_NYTH32866 [Nymphaea thermarum]
MPIRELTCGANSPESGVPLRAHHGLAYQPPLQLSPSAVEFFNPQAPPTSSREKMSPQSSVKPSATPIRGKQVMVEGSEATGSNHGIGAAGAVGIFFTLLFLVLLALSAYYVFVARRRDASAAQPAKPSP